MLARQNPFKPIIDKTVLPTTATEIERPPNFKKFRIDLPHDARVLKKIDLYYKSVDGSIKKMNFKFNSSIDWHKPIIISHANKKSDKNRYKLKFTPLSFISFRLAKNRIKIITNDKKIRLFHLSDPFKIVFDFQREANFLTKRVPLKYPPFVNLNIGNHEGFYRVVVTFDSSYKYRIKRVDGGFIVDVW